MATVAISNQELIALSKAIYQRFGLDFTNYESQSLKRGYARLVTKYKLDSLLELWQKIMRDQAVFPDWVDELTVGLTEMFRNPEAWAFIRNHVVTEFKHKSNLDIWHAGCSTGEEIHTMAILLKENGWLNKSRAIATDLSTTALRKAEAGLYPKMLLDKYQRSYTKFNPQGNFSSYFNSTEKGGIVIPELKEHVVFRNHNLVSDPMPEKFDIIFCRNVMIYFDKALKLQVLKMFHTRLKEDGFLIIGYFDMIPTESAEYFNVFTGQGKIYRRVSTRTMVS